MKTTTTISALLLVINFTTFASANLETEAVNKSRAMIEKSTPEDWRTYAQAAALCISQNTNLAEAALWLGQSLSVEENAYNLNVKGDYFALNNLPEKAIENYAKAIETGLKANTKFDVKELQTKIAEIIENSKTK